MYVVRYPVISLAPSTGLICREREREREEEREGGRERGGERERRRERE